MDGYRYEYCGLDWGDPICFCSYCFFWRYFFGVR